MRIAMSNVLMLDFWHDLRFMNGNFTSSDLFWLVIGALLAALLIWAYQRRRRRWF
jgi:LPXTG-motif cell wall-anchored protein